MSYMYHTLQRIEKWPHQVDWIDYQVWAFWDDVSERISNLLMDDFVSEYGNDRKKKSPVSDMVRVRSYIDGKKKHIYVLCAFFQNNAFQGYTQIEERFHPDMYQEMKRIFLPLQIPTEILENSSQ